MLCFPSKAVADVDEVNTLREKLAALEGEVNKLKMENAALKLATANRKTSQKQALSQPVPEARRRVPKEGDAVISGHLGTAFYPAYEAARPSWHLPAWTSASPLVPRLPPTHAGRW